MMRDIGQFSRISSSGSMMSPMRIGPMLGESESVMDIRNKNRLRDHFDEGRSTIGSSFFRGPSNAIVAPFVPFDLIEAEVDQARGWAAASVEAAEFEAQRQVIAAEASLAMEVDEAVAAAQVDVAEAQKWAKEEVAEAQAEVLRERKAAEAAMLAEEKALDAEAEALREVAEIRTWAKDQVEAAQAEAQRKIDAALATAEERAQVAAQDLEKEYQASTASASIQFDAEAEAAQSAADAAEAREWAQKQVSAALAEAEAAATRAKKASAMVVELQGEVGVARATAANATSFLERARELEAALGARQLQEKELQKLLAISNTEREEAKAQVLQLQQEVDAAQQAATKEKIKSDNLRDKALKLETKMELLKEDTAADFASRLDAATRGAAKDAAEKAKKQAERQVEAAQAEAQFQAKIAADAQAEVLQLKDELIAAKEAASTMVSDSVKKVRATMERQMKGIVEKVKVLQSEIDNLKSELSSEAIESTESKQDNRHLTASYEAKLEAQKAAYEDASIVRVDAATSKLRDRVRELEESLSISKAQEKMLQNSLSSTRNENEETKLRMQKLQRQLESVQEEVTVVTATSIELKQEIKKRPSEPIYKEALRWFRKAAEVGDPQAQLNLGIVYMNGHGVARNDEEAARWWILSAEQGNVKAQNNLGYLYWSGRGVPQSFSEALSWYRKAANQGNADAQSNLGLAYENGQGVETDLSEAEKWYELAAAQGQVMASRKLESIRARSQQISL
jgi:TPR repeat protein